MFNISPRRAARTCSCITLLLGSLAANASNDSSGTIKVVHGDVRIERAGLVTPALVGDAVQALDRVSTGMDGSVGITLKDETQLSSGPNSALVVRAFAFDTKTHEGKLETSLLKGTLRFVSGLMAKLNPRSVQIVTRQMTIGIRGTDFIVEVPDED